MAKAIKILIFSAAGLIIIFLVLQDLVWTGRLVAQTDFREFTPYFSVLKPQTGVEIKSGGNYLKSNQVYFDLFMPRDFKQARLKLAYADDFNYQVLVGPNRKPTSSNSADWDLKPLEDLPGAAGNYKIKTASFDLSQANINNGRLRFTVSVPDLVDANQGITIKSAKVILTRPALWQENWLQNFSEYLNYVQNQHAN